MKVTIESTTKIVNANGIDCRVREGKTERGVEITCLVPRIALKNGQDMSQFEAELKEQAEPPATIEAWPARRIL